jgi:hypothetical protein
MSLALQHFRVNLAFRLDAIAWFCLLGLMAAGSSSLQKAQ